MASSSWILVDDADPRVQYSPGWQAFVNGSEVDGTKHGAASAGLTATFSFTGTQVTVVGSLGSVDVHGVPTSLYTLDGAQAGLYTAPVIDPGFFRLNVTFFTSKALAPGDHTLVITNVNGTSPNVFWLDYVEYVPSAAASSSSSSSSSTTVVPTTSPSSSSSSSSSPSSLSSSSSTSTSTSTSASISNSTSTSSTTSSSLSTTPGSSQASPADSNAPASTSHNRAGAIAGGVVGGVALVLAIALLLVFLRRRRRHANPSPYPSVRPFGSWRSPDAAQAITPASAPPGPPSQKQMSMMTMAGGSTPTLSTTLASGPTLAGRSPAPSAGPLPPPSSAGSAPTERLSPSEPATSSSGVVAAGAQAGGAPQVVHSVDSGLRLAGKMVVLPPPYTRE